MKRLALLFAIATYSLNAQPQVPPPGSNQTNTFVDKFEGTWQWVSGTDTMIIRLKKFNTQFRDYSQDAIIGVHRYVRNGQVIEDALPRFDSLAGNRRLNKPDLVEQFKGDKGLSFCILEQIIISYSYHF